MAEDKQREIKVSVPMRLPVEQRQELFAAVVGAVEEWEPPPAERDEWDADVAGCPADEWPEVVAERSSRQAWAEEALRLEHMIEAVIGLLAADVAWQRETYGDGTDKVAVGRLIGTEDAYRALKARFRSLAHTPLNSVCACLSAEDVAVLAAGGFSRPQCSTQCPTCGGWLHRVQRGGLTGPHGWRLCSLDCIDDQVESEAQQDERLHLNVRDLLCGCAVCQRHGLPTDAMRAEYEAYRAGSVLPEGDGAR